MTTTDGRSVLHVDMDAFFASVELLRHPELVGKPVIVGGTGERGVVAAASYEARYYGVHSAMPSVRARRLCPNAVFVPGDHAHYQSVSAQIMDIFEHWTPLVEPLSLDEAFLDVTGARRIFGESSLMAADIRATVLAETGLYCSIGIASNKFLAKLATSRAKPRPTITGPLRGRGVFELQSDAESRFLSQLPIGDVWGVGPVTLNRLEPLGVATLGDVVTIPVTVLAGAIGRGAAERLMRLAQGLDDRPVVPNAEPKSISHEETFAVDVTERDELAVHLHRQVDGVATRLRKRGVVATTVHLKLRYGDFRTITRSRTLRDPTADPRAIRLAAQDLLDEESLGEGIRLIGVGVSGLGPCQQTRQMSFDELLSRSDHMAAEDTFRRGRSSWDRAVDVVDEIRDRFGDAVIGPASLAGRNRSVGDHQWGPDDSGTGH